MRKNHFAEKDNFLKKLVKKKNTSTNLVQYLEAENFAIKTEFFRNKLLRNTIKLQPLRLLQHTNYRNWQPIPMQ